MANVCFLTSVHPAFDTRIFHREIKTLLKAGYKVSFVAPHGKDEMVDGVAIISIKKWDNRLKRMLLGSLQVLRKSLKAKADAYHFHDPELIIAGLMLKLLGKKVIYDVHEDYPSSLIAREYLPRILRRPVSKVVQFIETHLTKTFDAIIVATENIRKNFVKHPRVETIRNFPFLTSVKKETYMNDGQVKIVYAGILIEINGITEIVRATEYLEDVNLKLFFCGTFRPRSYAETIRNLRGFKNVEYLGWIDYREIPAFLSRGDVGVLCCHPVPNSVDSLPNKLFEYMSVGLPVVVSNFPLWKDIVEGNKCGICVDPRNAEEIAQALRHLSMNAELRREMGVNARRAVENTYNWSREENRFINFYKKVVKQC